MTPDWVSALANVAMAAAAIAAAWAAIGGINSWRKQAVWQRDHELARKLLVCQYSLRDQLYAVRNPFMSGAEWEPQEGEEAAKTKADEKRLAYSRRWERFSERAREREALLLEADAIWGKGLRIFVKDLRELEHELYRTVHLYLDECSSHDEEMRRDLRELRKSKRDILFELSEEKDSFRSDYAKAEVSFEDFLRGKLGGQTP